MFPLLIMWGLFLIFCCFLDQGMNYGFPLLMSAGTEGPGLLPAGVKPCSPTERDKICRYEHYYAEVRSPLARADSGLSVSGLPHTSTSAGFHSDQLWASLSGWQVGSLPQSSVCDFLQIVLICVPVCAGSPRGDLPTNPQPPGLTGGQ